MSSKRKGASRDSSKRSKIPKSSPVDLLLSEDLSSHTTIQHLKAAWRDRLDSSGHPVTESEARFSSIPFRHCVLSNFLQDEEAIRKLQDDLMDLDFVEKNNDLYKFHQSKEDLKTAHSGHILGFRKLLCTAFREWLMEVSGIALNETVDTFCAQYVHTDTLLCHDDELEGRRIAYIYYLVNNWSEEDGGALDLFSVDENLQPKEVVKSILPERNMFAFFEVTPGSYHQVSEILSEDKTRLSISGWFHGPPIERPSPYIEKPRQLHSYGSIDDDVFFDWINPVYLSVGAQGSIQEKFETESEIELQDFLQKDKYEALLNTLKSTELCWRRMGPANKRCYEQADDTHYPAIVKTCIELFKSDAMFLLLSNLTGLKLHELAAGDSEEESGGSGEVESEAEEESEAKEEEELEMKGSAKAEAIVETESGVKSKAASKAKSGMQSKAKGDLKSDNKPKGSSADQTKKEAEQNAGTKSGRTEKEDEENSDKPMAKPVTSECTARCRTEVRHWKHRSYTLVHDTDTEGSEFALDLVLYVGCQDWEMDYGAFTSYIAKGEDEELLTVAPHDNSLALVYRDQETLKFVKYLNTEVNKMRNRGFFDISAVYYE